MTKRPPVTNEGVSDVPEAPVSTRAGRAHDRPVAAGGRWRLLLGFLIGALLGALLALILPRDDGPRRVSRPVFPADPLGPGPPDDAGPPRR